MRDFKIGTLQEKYMKVIIIKKGFSNSYLTLFLSADPICKNILNFQYNKFEFDD